MKKNSAVQDDLPIINSLLDTDLYKLTTGQYWFLYYGDIESRFAFTNRTKSVRLPEKIDIGLLRENLDHIIQLRFSEPELNYIASIPNGDASIFELEYINFLRRLRFPEYSLEVASGEFRLEFYGNLAEATYWEIPALAIIKELYTRSFVEEMTTSERIWLYRNSMHRFDDKTRILCQHPWPKIMEFGTRRRHSRLHQRNILERAIQKLNKQLLGTSNVKLAMEFGIEPKGTMAHELFMAISGITHGNDEEIRASHNKALQDWWNLYGPNFSIALTDTYGTDFFFRDFTEEQARNWKGLRQDSGDPIKFGRNALNFYRKKNINPKSKVLFFSDGLDQFQVMRIAKHFNSYVETSFGVGTNFTDDLAISHALSIVIKAVEANGNGLVKLSDNIAKAIGKFEDIERFKRIFVYTRTGYEECKY